jgi:hypothetical protein
LLPFDATIEATAAVPPKVPITDQATAGGRRNTQRSRQTNIWSFAFASGRRRFTPCTRAIILCARFLLCLRSIRQSTQQQQTRWVRGASAAMPAVRRPRAWSLPMKVDAPPPSSGCLSSAGHCRRRKYSQHSSAKSAPSRASITH